jgi:hypothetical protein
MPEEKAGSRLVGIILAAVVLLVLLGFLIYLGWREANPKPKVAPSALLRNNRCSRITRNFVFSE